MDTSIKLLLTLGTLISICHSKQTVATQQTSTCTTTNKYLMYWTDYSPREFSYRGMVPQTYVYNRLEGD